MGSGRIEIVCPCCETKLKIDKKTGEVIWEEKKKLVLFWVILIAIAATLTQSFSGILGIVFFGILIVIFYLPFASSNMFTNVTMKLLLLCIYLLVALIIFINILVSERLYKYFHEIFGLYSLLDGGAFVKFTGFVYDLDGNIDDSLVIGTVYQYSMVNVFPIWHLWTEIREFNFLHFFIGNGLGSASVINRYYMHSNEMINPNANIIRSLYETGVIGTLLFIAVFLTPIK